MALLPTAAAPLSVCLQLTHAINRSDRLEDIYEAALDALESGLGIEKAAILLFDPDGVMRFKGWRNLSDSYRRAVEGHTPWAPGVKGAEPIVVADVTENADLAPFLQTLLAERIAALAFIPLEPPRRQIRQAQQLVALPGWGVHDLDGLTNDQIKQITQEEGPGTRRAAMLGMLRDLRHGDGIITPHPPSWTILFGRLGGPYHHQENGPIPDHPDTRPVRWIGRCDRMQLPHPLLGVLDHR